MGSVGINKKEDKKMSEIMNDPGICFDESQAKKNERKNRKAAESSYETGVGPGGIVMG